MVCFHLAPPPNTPPYILLSGPDSSDIRPVWFPLVCSRPALPVPGPRTSNLSSILTQACTPHSARRVGRKAVGRVRWKGPGVTRTASSVPGPGRNSQLLPRSATTSVESKHRADWWRHPGTYWCPASRWNGFLGNVVRPGRRKCGVKPAWEQAGLPEVRRTLRLLSRGISNCVCAAGLLAPPDVAVGFLAPEFNAENPPFPDLERIADWPFSFYHHLSPPESVQWKSKRSLSKFLISHLSNLRPTGKGRGTLIWAGLLSREN